MLIISALFLTLSILTISDLAIAQSDSSAAAKPKFSMMTYQMVFLSRGPNAKTIDSVTSKKLFEGHMDNIKKLAAEGKLVIAGPFGDKGDLRGIFIMDVPTKEEAERLCLEDPAVKAGALQIEIKPWYGPKGLSYDGKE
jgi:uncharacterized protein